MKKMWCDFKRWVDKYRYVMAIAGIAFGSSLITLGTSSWYYNVEMSTVRASFEHQITRLQSDIDHERRENRTVVQELQADMKSLTAQMAQLLDKLDGTTDTAVDAAKAVKSAANTVRNTARKLNEQRKMAESNIHVVIPESLNVHTR